MEDHDRGLQFDMPKLLSRRKALGLFGGSVVTAALAACGASKSPEPTTTATGAVSEIPDETAGPYPGDGSNGPNVLAESGVVRRDITKSFGDASGVATGVPMEIEMTLIDVARGGKPLAGAAVYAWHCDQAGRYSLYDDAIAGENYLRGVQQSDSHGKVRFTSVFPAAYAGRWPHVHFEIYESLDGATSGGTKLKTSQIALPKEICETVYGSDGYEESLQNLAQVSLDSDMVFGDGYASELATASGDAGSGVNIKLNVGV
jgi:protocatechuate 3,4-dioxygenase beta subunit